MSEQDGGDVDHYGSVISGMKEGLLITVNSSGGANARAYPVMEVINQPVDGAVILESDTGDKYMMHQRDGDTIIAEHNDGGFRFETFVETIEVMGYGQTGDDNDGTPESSRSNFRADVGDMGKM